MTLKEAPEDLSALVSLSYADYLELKKEVDMKLIDVTNPNNYKFYEKDKAWIKAKEEYDSAKMKKRDIEHGIYFSKILTQK